MEEAVFVSEERVPEFVRGFDFIRGSSTNELAADAAIAEWWLVIDVERAPDDSSLCLLWVAEGSGTRECQVLPTGVERLTFRVPDSRGVDGRTFSAQLLLVERKEGAMSGLSTVGNISGSIEEIMLAGSPRPVEAPLDTAPAAPDDPGLEMPAFEWPPPPPTSRVDLERSKLAGDGAATLGDVADHLVGALESVGYTERSFYAVPGGFAMVTRLEQIESDGTPKPEPIRWSTEVPRHEVFSVGDYFYALFTAPEGNYRVIVFVVNDRPFSSSGDPIDADDMEALLHEGFVRLPREIAGAAFTRAHEGVALVYQFRKVGRYGDPSLHPSGAPNAHEHLARTRIYEALDR